MKALEQLQAVIGVAVLLVIVVICAQRAFGRRRGKRTSTTSNPLEVVTEAFSPARHATVMELRSHQGQGPVTPVPDDLPDGDATGTPGEPAKD
jgi:hypothetical protein